MVKEITELFQKLSDAIETLMEKTITYSKDPQPSGNRKYLEHSVARLTLASTIRELEEKMTIQHYKIEEAKRILG